jgi:uncharacterized membrane protein YphA (DoxX/SURF4 family)
MPETRPTRRVALLLRALLGVVFLYAAYTKLSQPWLLFALSIDSYQLLPEWAVLTVARTLPWLELLIGVLLLSGWQLRYVSIAASAMLLLFFSVMVAQYAGGTGIDCGCFGVGEALSGKTLARDGALLAAALTLVALSRQAYRAGPKGGPAGPKRPALRT